MRTTLTLAESKYIMSHKEKDVKPFAWLTEIR